jgi:uncharacterized phage protein (TIGR01671 family)
MNEIFKFRAWDKTLNKWASIASFILLKHVNDGKHTYIFPYQDDERFIIQQFTGLKDKNGKEIFEGDIVKEKHFEDWSDKEGFDCFGVVRHNVYIDSAGNQFSGFKTFPNLENNEGYAGNPIKENTEVVGNIFENPDLL